MRLDTLSFPALGPLRLRVADVLIAESSQPFATGVLRISPAYADLVARNSELLAAPAAPAGEIYAGALYRALDLPSLSGAARRRGGAWIVIQSPLYGAVRPGDRVAPYLLSMNSPLPRLAPLANRWREPLGATLPAAVGHRLLVDCRSGAYASAWKPGGELGSRWVRVRVAGPVDRAKRTHGLLARRLIEDGVDAQRPQDLADYLGGHFEVRLQRSLRGAREWLLDVTPAADDFDH